MMKRLRILFIAAAVLLLIFAVYKNMSNNQPTGTITYNTAESYAVDTVTHTWYSSLFFDTLSGPLFAIPNSYKLVTNGVEVSKPQVVFTEKSIFYSHNPDFLIAFPGAEKVINKKVTQSGEWNVKVAVQGNEKHSFKFHVIKGNPVFYFSSEDTPLQLTGKILEATALSQNMYLVKTFDNKMYVFQSANALTFNGATKTFTFPISETSHAITALPDEFAVAGTTSAEQIKTIATCANAEPERTNYSYSRNSSEYNVQLRFGDSTTNQYLTTLWPHHNSHYLQSNNEYQSLGTYKTSKGLLQLICTNSVNLTLKTKQLPTDMNAFIDSTKIQNAAVKDQFKQDYETIQKLGIPEGVYFRGKYLKSLVDLWYTSKLLGEKTIEAELYKKVRDLLVGDLSKFSFDKSTGLVMHTNPEFGSEKGNDHHFHFGYYLYVYTTMYDTFSAEEQEKVNAVIENILKEGTPSIIDPSLYPRQIRFLDVYEGHSWADAQALFGDGNNQESTSEALFYWYSLYLWGQKSNNKALTETAEFAYFTELSGRDAYWFLLNNEFISSQFKQPIISLVWGGKSDYATWFSAEEDKIIGIQLLPPNPGMMISLNLQDYKKEEVQKIFTYYDRYFANSPPNPNFYPFYLYFKKVNNNSVNFNLNDPQKAEIFPLSLYLLMK